MDNIFAYIAGYIDGDGCFYIGKTLNRKIGKTKYQSAITVSSTNISILNFFAAHCGGSTRMSDSRIKYSGQKPQYQWIIKGKKAQSLIREILPYLIEKADLAVNFMHFLSYKMSTMKDACIEFSGRLRNHNQVDSDFKELYKKVKPSKNPTEADFAYLAGFIDAECCMSIQHYKPKNKPNDCFKILLSCNNTNSASLIYLVERFGGNLHFIDRSSLNPTHKDQLTWRLSGRALSKILPSIHKYLRYKQPVCEELIKFYKTTLPNGGARHTDEFRSHYAQVLEIRKCIVNKVHKLNLKGIPT